MMRGDGWTVLILSYCFVCLLSFAVFCFAINVFALLTNLIYSPL